MNSSDKLKFSLHFKNLLNYLENIIRKNILGRTQLIIYEKSLIDVPRIEAKIRVAVRPVALHHIKKLAEVRGGILGSMRALAYERNLRKRLENGHICFIAEDKKGQIVGYCWVAFHEIFLSEISKKLELSPEEADLYDAFIFPEYRGKKIYQKILQEIFTFLRKNQYVRAYGHALIDNIPSRRGIARVGYRPKKVVTLLRLFGFKIYSENNVDS